MARRDSNGEWIDITLPITRRSTAWAGLPEPAITWLAHFDDGDAVQVGQLEACLHSGTHADAPRHVRRDGATVDGMPLDPFIGPACVVRLSGHTRITRDALLAAGFDPARSQRVLIATDAPFDGIRFPDRVIPVDPDLAGWLAEHDGRLLGVDQPSVDPLDSRTLDAHRALLDRGVYILENIRLAHVPAGSYWLAALPIAVEGADAAPVRAALRAMPNTSAS